MNETYRLTFLLALCSSLLPLEGCGKAKYVPVVKPIPLGSGDGSKVDGPSNSEEASKFFKEKLTPEMNISCSGCHRIGGIAEFCGYFRHAGSHGGRDTGTSTQSQRDRDFGDATPLRD
jgi:hypothetical protein